MNEVKLEILGLFKTEQKTYALVLQDAVKKKCIEIIIGSNEGQAIALGIEKIKTNRPLTHDLFKNLSTIFSIVIEKIVICDLIDEIFYAKIICKNSNNTKEIDARVSDAIALAVRFNADIYINENILSAVGIPIANDNSAISFEKPIAKKTKKNELDSLSKEMLSEKLTTCLKEENYEKAAEIKKILDKRDKEKRNK